MISLTAKTLMTMIGVDCILKYLAERALGLEQTHHCCFGILSD
ncbi:hypothetical protein [Pseudomonas fragi]|nr:hypothetical protein [Pseudomonas fragi]